METRCRLTDSGSLRIIVYKGLMAMVIVPMIIITLRRAWLERFDRHRIIARWTLPMWFYVSVTGVIVYLMVYQIYVAKSS